MVFCKLQFCAPARDRRSFYVAGFLVSFTDGQSVKGSSFLCEFFIFFVGDRGRLWYDKYNFIKSKVAQVK